MGADSKIQWCDHTFNPWIGCTKVSPGCTNCYAEDESKRRGWAQWGKGKDRHRTSEDYWKQPLRWNKWNLLTCPACKIEFGVDFRVGAKLPGHCSRCNQPTVPRRVRVFCASLADWLDDEVPESWRADLMTLIYATPNLDWLLLSKRLENWSKFFEGPMPDNVWIGTSVEDQKRADERIPKLLEIPAKIRFLSCEPLLGSVDLGRFCFSRLSLHHDELVKFLHWVIVGGESGTKARPCEMGWIREIAAQCKAGGVPIFVKQLGAIPISACGDQWYLKDRKGGDMSEWPEDLHVREFPVAGTRL